MIRRLIAGRRSRAVLLIAALIVAIPIAISIIIAQSELLPYILVAVIGIVALAVAIRWRRKPAALFLAAAAVAIVIAIVQLTFRERDVAANALMLVAYALAAVATFSLLAGHHSARMGNDPRRIDAIRIALSLAAALLSIGVLISLGNRLVWGSGSLNQLQWLSATPWHSPMIWKAAVFVDAVGGALTLAACALSLGRSRVGAAAAGVLWAIAPARLAPETLHLLPTFLLPLACLCAIRWRASEDRRWLLGAGACYAVALVAAPALAVALTVIAVAVLLVAPDARKLVLSAKTLVWLGIIPLATLLVAHAAIGQSLGWEGTLIGQSVSATVRADGGDGAYPWEIFMPSLMSGVFAPVGIGLFRLSAHSGHIYSLAIAPGWAAWLLGATPLLLGSLPAHRRLSLFVISCAIISVITALPSHVYGVPVPTITALLSGISQNFAGGAQLGLGATFAIVLAAPFGVDALRSTPTARKSLVAAAAGLLLVLDAAPNLSLLSSPAESSLSRTVAWSVGASDGRPIAFYPFVGRGEPVSAQLEYALARAHGRALNFEPGLAGRAMLERALKDNQLQRLARDGIRYVVVAPEAYHVYAVGTLESQVALPSDLTTPTWQALVPTNEDIIDATIASFHGDVVVYRLR